MPYVDHRTGRHWRGLWQVGLPSSETVFGFAVPVWFDPATLSTMKQERTGASATTPAAVDSPVGSHLNRGSLGGWATAPSDAARPILRSSGGLYWLEFDGTDDCLSWGAEMLGLLNAAPGCTLVAARRVTAITGASQFIQFISRNVGGSTRNVSYVIATTGFPTMGARRLDADGFVLISDDAAASIVATQVQTAITDYANSNADLYLDGVNVATSAAFLTDGTTSATASVDAYTGSGGAASFFGGRIYDALALGRAITAPERSTLEAFIAGKSGVTL